MSGAGALLLVGGTVLPGDGSAPSGPSDVLVEGDRIVAVGPTAAELAGPSVERIDATGHTVMPGLIDAHCHITFGEPASNDELFFHRDRSTAALVAAFDVQKLLLAGVTGFLDADCLWNLGPALRDAIEAGVVEGPRMTAGMNALLTAAGGTAGRLIPDSGTAAYAHVVGDRDEMVRTTRQQIKHGADWIKIHVTGSLPNRSGELTMWTLDELRSVTDTAHDLGTPCIAHCRNASSTRLAAEAGVDLILHASFMDDTALAAVVDAGCAIAPTFTFLANLADHGHQVGAGSGQVELFRGEIEATAAMVRAAHDAGVRILSGSESGFALTPYGHWHARELEVLVEAVGLSPLEAIRCATAAGALALRMQDGTIGVVAEGAAADLLVVDGDPSRDVTILGDRANLRHVISRGRRVDLDRPWPQRRPLPGEKVGQWATELLTREAAGR
ncbi:MAG: amidohydrolase family protein [Ilumatobacteraceae bacterium]|nr:amidohydrolase family protein [Ilumatobacteraceae bacterium]